MPDYRKNDPKGWCGDPSRGAALGRPRVNALPRDASVKLFLRRVRIDSQGYDSNGTYFGVGKPLYWIADAEGLVDDITRADDREHAKSIVRCCYPNARFYR